jgi:ferredoxin
MNAMRYIPGVVTLKLNSAVCTGCGMCAVVCPHRIFTVEARKSVVGDRDRCMECGACMVNCPSGALTVSKGVGCATAVISGWVKGGEPSCGCGDSNGPSCCG